MKKQQKIIETKGNTIPAEISITEKTHQASDEIVNATFKTR